MTIDYPETGHDWCAAVEDASWWFRHRNRFLVEVMRRFPPPPDTPLYDVGGGNGVVAAALQKAGIPTVVVEPGEAGARRARTRGLESICATMESAGFAPASLGSIGMFDVVEHIQDGSGFLQRARALLKPRGRIYLTVPAYRILWSAEDVYAHHFRRYTARSMRRTLEAAGFEVELSTYMFALLPLPILLMRSIPYRLGRARPFTLEGARDDHTGTRGISRALVDRLLDLELRTFRTLGALPFGASVVAVGRKSS
ncbi:MAG TPA: class I SAM-dependent methyltransferase [Gemmatimonadaceae bacterium]|jgi:SAM-dependent methyltransferase